MHLTSLSHKRRIKKDPRLLNDKTAEQSLLVINKHDNMSCRFDPVGVIVELWGVGHEFLFGANVNELLAGCFAQGEHNFLEIVAKVVGVLSVGLESAVADESLMDLVCLLGGDGGSAEHLVAECHEPFKEIQ